MDWVMNNLPLLVAWVVVAWILYARLIRPKMLGIKKMTAGEYPGFEEAHTLVDVRSRNEWNSGHPANAVHIPLNELPKKMGKIPKNKPVVVICASGMRSSMAAGMLVKAGYADVYNFAGGFGSWCAAGLPRA